MNLQILHKFNNPIKYMDSNNNDLEDQFHLVNKMFSNFPNNYTKEDKEAYLLSKKWLVTCRNFFFYYKNLKKDKDASLNEETTFPPIDNNDLIDNDANFLNNNVPKYFFFNRQKKIDIDFIVVKANDWKSLLSKFGGGPALPVPLGRLNIYHIKFHPVTDFFDIFVSYRDILNQRFVTYGEIYGKELENNLRSFFDVPKFEKTRLIFLNSIIDANKTLDQQLVMIKANIKLECQDSEGNWISPGNDKKNNTKPLEKPRLSSLQRKKDKIIKDAIFQLSSLQKNEKKTNTEIKETTIPFSHQIEKLRNEKETPNNASIPPPSQQLRIFQELERINNLFTEGEDNAYLISLNWFRLWKSIVDPKSVNRIKIGNKDNDNTYNDNQNDITIPPIDNHDLMIFDEKLQVMKPDRSKKEQIDFRILHPNVWKKLHEWFGGGPEIAVPVYYSQTQKELAPVVQFYDIPIDYKDKKTNNLFEIGKNTPLSLIHTRARDFFDAPENEETRICVLNQSGFRVLPDQNRLTLDSYVLFSPNTHLVLDFKEKGSHEWNIHATDTSTCRSSSSMRPIVNSNSTSDFNDGNNSDDSSHYSQSQHSLDQILPSNNSNNYDYRHYSHSYYSREAEGPGICGLMNLGNTCFFNSGIQCLVHTRLLIKYILKGKWKQELNRSNPIGMHGEVAEAFANLTYKIWSGHYNTISPNEMKDVIGRFAPQFSGYGQQDSHELITFMLDGIHEDLNRVTRKPVVDSISGDGSNDDEIADESWKRYKMRNDSIIVDLFHSQLRSRLVCPKCKKVTVVFDPYMSIQLPIHKPNKQVINIIFVPSKLSRSYIQNEKQKNNFLFDVEYKHIKVSINKNKRYSSSDISEIISKKVGRKVDVVICSKESSTNKPCLFKVGINSFGNENYALEIPDQENNQKFLICSLISKAKKKYMFYPSDDYVDIMPPFLLPIPSFNISPSDILEKCDEFFEGFWSGDDKPLNEEQQSFKDSLKIELLRSLEDEESIQKVPKFLCEKNFTTLFPSREFNPRVASFIFPVAVNQAAMGEEFHFSFYLYLKHIKDRKFGLPSSLSSNSFSDSSSNSTIELEKCFKYFSTNETLDENNKWFCPNCRDFVCADKKMDIWSAPEILVIQLKRFIRYNEFYLKKLDSTVDYPSEIDISKFLAGPQRNEKMIYRLYAVSEHSGSLNGGHYTAHAKVSKKDQSEDGGKWYSFNDSFVSSSNKKSAHNSAAYVLFYERVNKNKSAE